MSTAEVPLAETAKTTETTPRTTPEIDTIVGDRVVRFDRAERWLHWVNATLVLILIATGSCLYIGALSGLVGRRVLLKNIHIWTGFVLPIPFLLVVFTRWGHGFRRDSRRLGRFLTDDWRWLRKRQRRFGGLRVGKFNAGQKINAILVAGTLPVMFGTGLLLYFSHSLPLSWRTGTTFVHDWGYVALSLLIAGHIVKALADPISLRAMRVGTVPKRWARDGHPRWYAEMADPSSTGGSGPASPYDDPPSDQPEENETWTSGSA